MEDAPLPSDVGTLCGRETHEKCSGGWAEADLFDSLET
jgi:hypothetical protein